MFWDSAASTPPMAKTDDSKATDSHTALSSDSSSGTSALIEGDGQQKREGRRKLVGENRKLWESTLPEASISLCSHVEPGYNYRYINHENTAKKEVFRRRRKRFDFLEFPNPFRN